MSFEAISNITQAEAAAKATLAGAETRAKQLAADAESAGKLAVDAAVAKAEAELQELSDFDMALFNFDTSVIGGGLF